MGRRPKFFEDSEPEQEEIFVETIVEEPVEKTINLNEYLASFNRNRNLDNVLKKWFSRIDSSNPSKTKFEWDNLIRQFEQETA